MASTTAMSQRPVLVFVLTLGILGPIVAMAGVAAGGSYAPISVATAGTFVALTALRAIPVVRATVAWRPRRLRMLAVLWSVTVASGLLAAGALAWFLLGIF